MESEALRAANLRERVASTADPVRLGLVGSLAAAPATARDLAERSGTDLRKVRYVLGRWLRAGIVECEGDRALDRRSGRKSNLYRLRPGALLISSAESKSIRGDRLNQARSRALGVILRQAMAVAAEGTFGAQEGHSAFRLPMTIDPEGHEEAVRLHEETIASIVAISEASTVRLRVGSEDPIPASACVSFFQRPPVQHSQIDGIDLAALAPTGKGPRNIGIPGAREDPLRFEVEYLLITRPLTVAELVEELAVGPDSVRRALSILEKKGAISVHSLRQTRGTVEKRYLGDPRAKYNAGIPGSVGDRKRKAYEQRQIRIVAREPLAAAEAGRLASTAAFGWMPMILDRPALAAIADAMDALEHRMLDLREACLRRGSWESADRIPASTALMFFRND